jgi:hypothetical protein
MATAADEIETPRNGARKRVLMRGTLFTPYGAHVVWIRDLSPTGANVGSKDRLPAGCDVILKRGNLFVAAHIKRSNESGAGIEFYRELSEADLSAAAHPIPNS